MEKRFFSIAGIVCSPHTPRTLEIWDSWEGNKSRNGRLAVINYAVARGFVVEETDIEPQNLVETAKKAFSFLIPQFPLAPKSAILRECIIYDTTH